MAKDQRLSVEEQAELDRISDQEAMEALDEQAAAESAAASGDQNSGVYVRRQAMARKIAARNKAERDAAATVEVTVRPGRSIFTEHGQKQPHTGGSKIMVTPEEAAQLQAAGHLVRDDGTTAEPNPPAIRDDEQQLLVGQAAGQGAKK